MTENVKMRIRALLVVGMALTGSVVILSIPPLLSHQEASQMWLVGASSLAFLTLSAGALYLRTPKPNEDDR